MGANQQAFWRRLLGRLIQDAPEVGRFLHDHTADDTDIMEVDTTADTPTAEPV